MKIETLRWANDKLEMIDQRILPASFEYLRYDSAASVAEGIRSMVVRGAPAIGVAAAYGVAPEAMRLPASTPSLTLTKQGRGHSPVDFKAGIEVGFTVLAQSRPTAVNLQWALDQVADAVRNHPPAARGALAFARADAIAEEDVALNQAIGRHGLGIIRDLHACAPDRPVNILMHCNPGWLATVDYGTATAPIYLAHDEGLPVHVWVDETRPRNQGALTAFELAGHGVPHTYITDNAGGHLMMTGQVDAVFVGTDRVTANGDVCNKIGTYLKALAAADNGVPFYVALPYTTFDAATPTGADVPIEERSGDEVAMIAGARITDAPVANPAFDVTPARLVTGYITEKGVVARI